MNDLETSVDSTFDPLPSLSGAPTKKQPSFKKVQKTQQDSPKKPFSKPVFGSTNDRFSAVAGVHPRLRHPAQVPSMNESLPEQEKQRGPGVYPVPLDLTGKNLHKEAKKKKDEWALSFDTSKIHTLDRLRRSRREEKEEEQRQHGPGTYDLKDFTRVLADRSIPVKYLDRPGPRFTPINRFHENLPGPGHYGIPAHPRLERRSITPGVLSSTTKRPSTSDGESCTPGPGAYHRDDFGVDYGARSRNEMFFVEDPKPRFPAHFDPSWSLGPGFYGTPSPPPLESKIVFLKHERFPKLPGDRHTNATLAQFPRRKSEPSPWEYEEYCPSKPTTSLQSTFGKSSRKDQRECYKSNTFNGDIFRATMTDATPAHYNASVPTHLAMSTRSIKSVFADETQRFEKKHVTVPYSNERIRPTPSGK